MRDEWVQYVIDQLRGVPELRVRRMFGGHGAYSGERFFAILDADEIYLKTDASTRSRYEALGLPPFTYMRQGREQALGFHRVPADVLEDAEELLRWANEAIAVAVRATKTAPAKKHRKAAGKPTRRTRRS